MRPRSLTFAVLLLAVEACAPTTTSSEGASSVFLEELTWTEVRDALAAGKTSAIIPTGGTEDNGPHMVLGKHNYVVRTAAGEIAERLGNALVAPVLGYVPEGTIDPPTGHMWAPGTITLPQEHFEQVVEYAARSLAANGFTEILLLGDSGGNQAGLAAVAAKLNEEWAGSNVHALHIGDYYSQDAGAPEWLEAQGFSPEEIGTHAGILDTSLLMFIHPKGVRLDLRAPGVPGDGSGVTGDPTLATAELGRALLRIKVEAALRQIEALRG